MAFTTPTVDDFKAQFARDFPFAVPCYGAQGNITVTGGVIGPIGVAAGGIGYLQAPTVAVIDPTGSGAVVTATVANGVVTGFVVGNGGTGYTAPQLVITGGAGSATDASRVTDADIAGAIVDASFNINQGLFDTQANWARAFLFYAAHCMVERLLAAGEGLRSRYSWLVNAKSVGDLAESYTIPENILQSAFLSSISKTRYGARYLEIISPLLVGNMMTNFRITPP